MTPIEWTVVAVAAAILYTFGAGVTQAALPGLTPLRGDDCPNPAYSGPGNCPGPRGPFALRCGKCDRAVNRHKHKHERRLAFYVVAPSVWPLVALGFTARILVAPFRATFNLGKRLPR